jgi:hypothetical protein
LSFLPKVVFALSDMDVDERKARLLRAKQYSTLVRYVSYWPSSRIAQALGCWSVSFHTFYQPRPRPPGKCLSPWRPTTTLAALGGYTSPALFPLLLFTGVTRMSTCFGISGSARARRRGSTARSTPPLPGHHSMARGPPPPLRPRPRRRPRHSTPVAVPLPPVAAAAAGSPAQVWRWLPPRTHHSGRRRPTRQSTLALMMRTTSPPRTCPTCRPPSPPRYATADSPPPQPLRA